MAAMGAERAVVTEAGWAADWAAAADWVEAVADSAAGLAAAGSDSEVAAAKVAAKVAAAGLARLCPSRRAK